jgi:hypothetical protein
MKNFPAFPKQKKNMNFTSFARGTFHVRNIDDVFPGLQGLLCDGPLITEIKNLPDSLVELELCHTNVTKIENLPDSLKLLFCDGPGITKIENLPDSLHGLVLRHTGITKIENLPDSLQELHLDLIQFVDNVTIEDFNKSCGDFTPQKYTKIKKFQRIAKIWYRILQIKKSIAIALIQSGTHNWVFKPLCDDGTLCIRLRLDSRDLHLS